MDEYDPAYCMYCSTTTHIEDDHPCVVIFGVIYVECRGCGKSIPYS